MIKFGEWLPDQAPLENPGLLECENVLPASSGYKSFPGPLRYTTNAINARPQGAISVRDTVTNSQIYTFVGTDTEIYVMDGATFTNVSRVSGYNTTAEEQWEFVQWGNQVVATNFSDEMQVATIGSGDFDDLAGTPPKARHIATVRDFLVTGNTWDASDLFKPNRVRWAGIGTIDSWTVSATTQADFQDLQNENAGQIQKIVGGEFGLIFQQNAITRMSYIGSPDIFQFDLVESQRGALSPGSVQKFGNNVAYLSQDGFFVFDGQRSIPIGDGKVDQYFFDTVDRSYIQSRMSVALYPTENIICWSYASLYADNGMPDTILMYNFSPSSQQRWASAAIDTWYLVSPVSQSYTLDGLDAVSTNLDTLPFSLDSSVWMGLVNLLGTFDTDLYLNMLNGLPLEATITTGEAWLSNPDRTYVTLLRPHIDLSQGLITVEVGQRNLESEAATFTLPASPNSAGYVPVRANARFLRARFTLQDGFADAQGFDIMTTATSGRR